MNDARAAPDLSVVIVSWNSADSLGRCLDALRHSAEVAEASIEVIVVDNASDDDSAERARAAGATVVEEPRRGYGSAYLAGLAAARGRYVVLTDADDTYDLTRVPELVARLRDGADLVLGSRFRGRIHPGAMPWSHRWIGNPALTGMLNLLFRVGVSDAHCGLRAARRDALERLDLSTTGMEFASEMVIKASKRGLRIEEVPIDYRPRVGESKLNSVRDAWRHVRFMLVHSATWLFFVPGGVAMAAGLAFLLPFALERDLGDPSWVVPTAILASFAAVLGAQVVQLGLMALTYAVIYLEEKEPLLERAWRRFRLEHGLAAGAVTVLAGAAIALYSHLNSTPDTVLGLLGVTLVVLGVQAIFASFCLSVLGLADHAVVRRQVTR